MEKKFTDIYELIAKSFDGNITDEESQILEEWKAENDTNLQEYAEYSRLWENSKLLKFPVPIDISHALNITRVKANIMTKRSRTLWYVAQAAAVLLLALIFSGVYNYFYSPVPGEIVEETTVYQEMKAAFGTQSRVDLPDGSVVFLNSGSTLRFPVSFTGSGNRHVYLSGEGYFTVKTDKAKPFIVKTDEIDIKALGTSFNVDAYKNNSLVTVALVEGELELKKYIYNKDNEILMKPNQVVNFNKTENILSRKDDEDLFKYTAWTEGKIVFVNDPIDMVMSKLSNWYNVDIILADKRLYSYRFTGTFINEPVEQVLNILNLTSAMRYTIQPARKNGDNSYTKRKIFLRSK